MIFNGKQVITADAFSYSEVKPGDLVDAEVVMNAMDCLPPACMRLDCSQLGEPYSHRQDPETGKWRATYATFKCVQGGMTAGVWEYRGHCFRGENTERGQDPAHW